MQPELEIQEPDEARAPKRARLDGSLEVTEETSEEMADDEGWDDIYEKAEQRHEAVAKVAEQVGGDAPVQLEQPVESAIPGPVQPNQDVPMSEVRSEPIENGTGELIEEEQHPDPITGPVAAMTEELSAVNGDPNAPIPGLDDENDDYEPIDASAHTEKQNPPHPNSEGQEDSQTTKKVTEDPEFMAAAAAQKTDAQAEWQFDSSDAESSSDSSSDSDDTDSDDGSEGGYEMLDPATAAKILMAGDGDDDDGAKKQNGDHRPRTQNEAKEEIVPKPDVKVTPDMKITELGHIQALVENMALIKANTSGEYQVLESGSVLCNEQREVVGAVLETFGRVQEPMYSIQFTNKAESDALGMDHGAKVYYVDQHSTFVFTQPLRNMKGTDASNIYDEEVAEDEIEFSDDEAEAEYKRQKKLAKRGGRGGANGQQGRGGYKSFGAPGHDGGMTFVPRGDAPRQPYAGGLSYDEPADEFYQPLKRPDNLSQLMAGGAPPRPEGSFERGRGRGRGPRGRGGDRGRGRGGGHDSRGGRGGYQDQHRGNARSFPDTHNHSSPHSHGGQHFVGTQQQQQPHTKPHTQPQLPQPPSTYQFNGYNFQYGTPAPPPPQPTTYQQPYQSYQPFQQQAYYAAEPLPAATHANSAQYQPWQQPGQPPQTQTMNLENVLRQMGAVGQAPPPPPPPSYQPPHPPPQ